MTDACAATTTPDLTVVILTFNEAQHIERAIDSVRSIAHHLVVVDSFSTDETVRIAKEAGARVLQNAFISHARQFNWGMEHAGIETEWILRLDADEIIESDLAEGLRAAIATAPADVVGMTMDRKHIFMGRWIRHGGRYPVRLLRVWRRGHGKVEDKWMDEHIVIRGGRSIHVKGGFADVNLNDLTFFTTKHNKYATLEAVERLNKKYHLFGNARGIEEELGQRQAAIKRWIKEKIYNNLPFGSGPIGYFLFRYLIQLGFLDGAEGFIYHFLQGCWYRFLVEAKTVELESGIAACRDNKERIVTLSRLTNLSLEAGQ